mmetsp:Transcript_27989/g.59087  ORF Transcript_27989/g.59087 Transcript_27989/m.59087 type:complete len:263 (+) Transcript_27989:186-974(+)
MFRFVSLTTLLHLSTLFATVASFAPAIIPSTQRAQLTPLKSAKSNDHDIHIANNNQSNRREILQKGITFASLLTAPLPACAKNAKSRTTGYAIQHTESEWSDLLTPTQYFILRNGGTESPYSSILEGEERSGTYLCAGCGTPLFDAKEKFHSGTGWPSYAKPVVNKEGVSNVEMEDVSQIQYQLAGAEVRCQTCGGHLGDVFADGFLFPGTPAFVTGKRYCIDGAALLFVPQDQKGGGDGELEMMRGDLPPKNGGRGPVFPG